MRNFLMSAAALAVIGISIPVATANAETTKKVIIKHHGDRHMDRDRHHHVKKIVIKHRGHMDRNHHEEHHEGGDRS